MGLKHRPLFRSGQKLLSLRSRLGVVFPNQNMDYIPQWNINTQRVNETHLIRLSRKSWQNLYIRRMITYDVIWWRHYNLDLSSYLVHDYNNFS